MRIANEKVTKMITAIARRVSCWIIYPQIRRRFKYSFREAPFMAGGEQFLSGDGLGAPFQGGSGGFGGFGVSVSPARDLLHV
jgi:hypothetical protein